MKTVFISNIHGRAWARVRETNQILIKIPIFFFFSLLDFFFPHFTLHVNENGFNLSLIFHRPAGGEQTL